MLSANNGQVAVTLSGWAGDSRRLYYLSVIGTQAELKSVKAGLVTGKRINLPYLGSVSHKNGEPWREFTAPIPNSPFTHYLWVSDDPAFIFVSNPAAATTLSLNSSRERSQAESVFRIAAATTTAPAALYRSLDATTLPLPQSWAQTLLDEGARYRKVQTMDRYGDCVYAALRDLDVGSWKLLITDLVQRGKLQ